MTYLETYKKLSKLRRKDEVLFRMAISHWIDVGSRHLTEENIEKTCKELSEQEEDKRAIITNSFLCEIVKTAGEIAKLDHIHVLVYISNEVYYDVGQKEIEHRRLEELLCNCINVLSYDCDDLGMMADQIGMKSDEFDILGFSEICTALEEGEVRK